MTKYTFKLGYNKTKARDKELALWVIFDRLHRKVINTGIYLSLNQWDMETEQIIRHPGAALFNAQLAAKKKAIQELEVSCIKTGERFTAEYLTRILEPDKAEKDKKKDEPKPCFTDYMFKALCRQTQMKFASVRDQFKTHKRFESYFPGLLFKDFNYNTLVEFEKRCLVDGQARSTICKHHKNLKKYLNLAEKEGFYVYPPGKHPYNLFKVHKVTSSRAFLSESELYRLETGALPAHLDPIRRMFLFICYTGLRISDFLRIDPNMILDDVLVVKPQKTETSSGTEVHLPLKMLWKGRPWEIWESFGFVFPNKAKGFESRFNAALKMVALHLGISKNLSAHVGRHTFLTHMAVKTGNVFHVMQLGGIRKVDTAMIYIHLAEQDNKKFLAGVEW